MLEGQTPARAPDPAPAPTLTPLILDLLEWLAPGARPYGEVMEAWRTSCPRLTVWEDALDGGYVARQAGALAKVKVTPQGYRLLAAAGRTGQPPA